MAATGLVVVAAGLALGLAAARRQLRIGDEMAALTAVAIAGLLASPLSWTHHWVWGMPAIMILVARRQWMLAWLLGLVFAAGPEFGQTILLAQDSLTLVQQVACATYVAAGTALLALWTFDSGARDGGRTPSPDPGSTAVKDEPGDVRRVQ